MQIRESAEDYLEAILQLSETREHVRSIDVVRHLGISKPSVSVYLKNLKINGTDSGLSIASKIYERHKVLAKIFMSLGIPEDTAYEDACRTEHVLSDPTFEALKKHFEEFK